jgi:hypothetical protein
MRRAALLLVLASLVVALAPARADVRKHRDPRDTNGPFDLRAVSHGHTASGRITHTFETEGRWTWRRARCFENSSKCRAFFRIYFFRGPEIERERYIDVFRRNGKTYARMYRWRPSCFRPTAVCTGYQPEEVARPRVTRPDRRRLRVGFHPRALGQAVKSYQWSAYVVFWHRNECRQDSQERFNNGYLCWDYAPDLRERRIVHRL